MIDEVMQKIVNGIANVKPVDVIEIDELFTSHLGFERLAMLVLMQNKSVLNRLPPALQHQISRRERTFDAMVNRTLDDFNSYIKCVAEDFDEARHFIEGLPSPDKVA